MQSEDYCEIVDGYHQYLVMQTCEEITKRKSYHLPVTIIDKPINERISNMIRNNHARGIYSVDCMVERVQKLGEPGLND